MPPTALLCAFLISLNIFPISSAVGDDTLTAYEVLEEYHFPVGILPKGVTSYELNTTTGKFSVYLNETCSYSVDDYKLKYKSTITGVISKDKLKSLSGVSVKVLFFWLSITEVTRDGDDLEFSVGIASADFAVDNFNESPECGCGFDCVNGARKNVKFNWNRFVSSS